MTLHGFQRFLDLPRELRGTIWQFTAQKTSIPAQISLLRVSKESQAWIEKYLYENVFDIQGSWNMSLLSCIARRPRVFATTTKSIRLKLGHQENVDLTCTLLPMLSSLRRAAINFSTAEYFETFGCLLSLPNLSEVVFVLSYNRISASQCATITKPHMKSTITHVIVASYHPSPEKLDPHFLGIFSCMTHFAVRCRHTPDAILLQTWCNAAPASLRALVLMEDPWCLLPRPNHLAEFQNTVVNPSFNATVVLFREKDHVNKDIWDRYASMWVAVDEAISSSNRHSKRWPRILDIR
ncbi:hypothetical protein DL96DRAFT_1734661 [Flagelloscypha sp. PMI_526]|nr:hypothetical protein DL96DRAFT_1734661 [Flagelloscypha sp. PMI_526]